MSAADERGDNELLAELEQSADRERQLVDLIRIDYDATLRAMSGFVAAAAQIRAIGIAAWGVVLGLAVQDESALLACLALLILVLFAYGDAYHAALYRRALSRAINMEGLLDSYVDRLGIDAEDANALIRTRAKLETHRFGMNRTLRPLKFGDYIAARPHPVFRGIYPMIFAVTIGFVVIYLI